MLGLVLGIQVIKIAEELVEAMNGRQKLVAVAEMVLAELPGHVAERLEQIGERRILIRQPFLGSRQSNLQKAGAHRALAGDERGAAGGAGLLTVIVGEDRAFVGDAIDVGRAVAHHAAIVGADVPIADVIGHDDEDIRLLLLRGSRRDHRHPNGERCQQTEPDIPVHAHRSNGNIGHCASAPLLRGTGARLRGCERPSLDGSRGPIGLAALRR